MRVTPSIKNKSVVTEESRSALCHYAIAPHAIKIDCYFSFESYGGELELTKSFEPSAFSKT